MPIRKRWSQFSNERIANESDSYGVYEIANRSGKIQYIGQGRIFSRLVSHFLKASHPIPRAALYRVEHLGSKRRAEQRERALLAKYETEHGDLPPYNKRFG